MLLDNIIEKGVRCNLDGFTGSYPMHMFFFKFEMNVCIFEGFSKPTNLKIKRHMLSQLSKYYQKFYWPVF